MTWVTSTVNASYSSPDCTYTDFSGDYYWVPTTGTQDTATLVFPTAFPECYGVRFSVGVVGADEDVTFALYDSSNVLIFSDTQNVAVAGSPTGYDFDVAFVESTQLGKVVVTTDVGYLTCTFARYATLQNGEWQYEDLAAYVEPCYWEEDYCEDEDPCLSYDPSSLMAGFVFDRTVQDGPLTQTRVSVSCAHTRRDNSLLYFVDPVSGEILQWDSDEINRLPFEWKSKTFILQKPINFSFAQVILDDISSALAKKAKAVLDSNALLWGTPCSTGAFGDVGVDAYMVGGSCIEPVPTIDPEYTTLYVYADGILSDTINIVSEKLYRLKSDFLATKWVAEVAGNKGVRRITLATSAAEIAQQ